jgi:outer membrane protein assembly factor BamB
MRSLAAAALLLCLVLVRPSTSIATGTVTVLWNASAVNGEAVINFGGAVFDGGVAVNSRNSVKALNASTGRVMWNYSLPDTDLGFSRPVESRGVVYVIAGVVIAFDAKTGGILWAATMPVGVTGGSVAATVDEDRELLFVPTSVGLTVLNLYDGTINWTVSQNVDTFGPPALLAGCVVVTDYNTNVYIYDIVTGAPRFAVLPGPNFDIGEAVNPVGGCGVVVSMGLGEWYGTNVAGYDVSTGTTLWNITLPGYAIDSGIVKGCVLYIQDGTALHALNITTGVHLYQRTNRVATNFGSMVLPLSGDRAAYLLQIDTTQSLMQVVQLSTGDVLRSYNAAVGSQFPPAWLGVNAGETVFYTTTDTSFFAFALPEDSTTVIPSTLAAASPTTTALLRRTVQRV